MGPSHLIITRPILLSWLRMEPCGQAIHGSLPRRAAGRTVYTQLRNGLQLQPGPVTARATRDLRNRPGGELRGGQGRGPCGATGEHCGGGSPRWSVTSVWRGIMKSAVKRAHSGVVGVACRVLREGPGEPLWAAW